MPTIIALSDESSSRTAVKPYMGSDMDAFLSYLLFWQDTIDHCRSAEVNDTLLDHFQVLFLEQLLFVIPTLMASALLTCTAIPLSSNHPTSKAAPRRQS